MLTFLCRFVLTSYTFTIARGTDVYPSLCHILSVISYPKCSLGDFYNVDEKTTRQMK